MATKKQTITSEQAYRGAVLNLAQLGFSVTLVGDGTTARIRHPLAATLPYGADVSDTKLVHRSFHDRVEVDGKRVALGEVISRAVEQSLRDVEQAKAELAHSARVEQAKASQYEALVKAGFEKATKGLAYRGGRYASRTAESLGAEGKGLQVEVKRGDQNGRVVLSVEAEAEGYAALARLVAAATKATA